MFHFENRYPKMERSSARSAKPCSCNYLRLPVKSPASVSGCVSDRVAISSCNTDPDASFSSNFERGRCGSGGFRMNVGEYVGFSQFEI